MFAPLVPETSVTFVSQASITSGTVANYDLKKRVEPVRCCRVIGKKDMKFNDCTPQMKVDPESYRVEADGMHCKAEPADSLPLSQQHFIF